jgi:methionine biosynthesis protein MetW
MRNTLYLIKEFFARLYRYPKVTLEYEGVDYDSYWADKREQGLGTLSHWPKQRADMALAHMVKDADLSVLDIGCGDGAVLTYLKKNARVVKAIGVDVSAVALKKAAGNGVETIHSHTDPLESLPANLRVDYVLMFEVLEHMAKPEAQLRYMMSIADRGVFFSFPNTGYIQHRLRLLLGSFPLQWQVHPGEHLRFWTYRDLVWWLKALGIKEYTIQIYEGIPVLKKVWPALFGQAFFIYIPNNKAP